MEKSWDKTVDIVVVGYGFAGGTASIVAHDLGAKVLLLEKMETFGGLSGLSGGGIKTTDDVQGAFKYLKRTCLGTTPDDVLMAFAEGMGKLEEFIVGLAKVNGANAKIRRGIGANYPFDGSDSFVSLIINEVPGFEGYTWKDKNDTSTGHLLLKVLEDNVVQRGIEVLTSTPVKNLLTDDKGTLIGVEAQKEGEVMRVQARKGVILACGGFEHNENMKLQFFEAQPVYGVAAVGNTGDGIIMAQKLGASLWHMWHFHGSYGYKYPEFPIAFRHSIPYTGKPAKGEKMFSIVVDKFGKRYMNEIPPAPQDTPARDMSYYDPHIQDFPRIPSYIVFDETGRLAGPIANPTSYDPSHKYEWSRDNSKEIERGWIKSGQTIEELASKIDIDGETLRKSIDDWNRGCKNGADADFRRPEPSLHTISEAPFYATKVWPVVSNTQGGLVHDAKQIILDSYGKPIPRLYVAGELGSIFGHLYLQAGNLAECFIAGRVAAEDAVSEKVIS